MRNRLYNADSKLVLEKGEVKEEAEDYVKSFQTYFIVMTSLMNKFIFSMSPFAM